jgi:hypothetical protein
VVDRGSVYEEDVGEYADVNEGDDDDGAEESGEESDGGEMEEGVERNEDEDEEPDADEDREANDDDDDDGEGGEGDGGEGDDDDGGDEGVFGQDSSGLEAEQAPILALMDQFEVTPTNSTRGYVFMYVDGRVIMLVYVHVYVCVCMCVYVCVCVISSGCFSLLLCFCILSFRRCVPTALTNTSDDHRMMMRWTARRCSSRPPVNKRMSAPRYRAYMLIS